MSHSSQFNDPPDELEESFLTSEDDDNNNADDHDAVVVSSNFNNANIIISQLNAPCNDGANSKSDDAPVPVMLSDLITSNNAQHFGFVQQQQQQSPESQTTASSSVKQQQQPIASAQSPDQPASSNRNALSDKKAKLKSHKTNNSCHQDLPFYNFTFKRYFDR